MIVCFTRVSSFQFSALARMRKLKVLKVASVKMELYRSSSCSRASPSSWEVVFRIFSAVSWVYTKFYNGHNELNT